MRMGYTDIRELKGNVRNNKAKGEHADFRCGERGVLKQIFGLALTLPEKSHHTAVLRERRRQSSLHTVYTCGMHATIKTIRQESTRHKKSF